MDLWGIYWHHQLFPRRRKEVCKKCAKTKTAYSKLFIITAAYYKRYSQVEKYTYRDTRKRTMITKYLLRTIKELIVQFSYRYIILFSSLYVVTPICRKREKKEKRENNVTVRNASESTRKEKPWNIFLWIFLFLLSHMLFLFFLWFLQTRWMQGFHEGNKTIWTNTGSMRIVRWVKNTH